MSSAFSDDRWSRRRGGVTVARALGTPTRAGIYEHLQQQGTALTVRDVATAFDLHPNVARTHLETLADAGLIVVGRRKHPGGGRPAKVYLARDDAPAEEAGEEAAGLPSARLLVRLLVELVDPRGVLRGAGGALVQRAHEVGAAEGRRLVTTLPGQVDGRGPGGAPPARGLEAAAQAVVQALRGCAPQVRIVKAGRDWVDIAGMRAAFASLHEERPQLAEALERGVLAGALAAAGVPAALTDAGAMPDGSHVWRARVVAAMAALAARASVEPAAHVDARGQQRETGVVRAMRAVTRLQPGEVLEVFAEGPGSPAAFARWADRAGHELLGVERAVDASGQPAIRLLIRKGRH